MESKISFGFKKLPKKSAVIGAKPPEKEKVELIECIDDQSIKIIGKVEVEEKPLVIPMLGGNKNLLDRLKDVNDLKERTKIKYEKEQKVVEDSRPDSELTIEELAARKVLEDSKNYEKKKTAVKVVTIPIEDQLLLEGAKEPTMNDYEAVPISDYGYAMLRGMGWSEDTAKKNKIEAPSLRPKGMGLGASVATSQLDKPQFDKDGKKLKMEKDAKVKIIAGKENGKYCIVQGFDEDSGRVIIKTAIGGNVLSVNEFTLLLVTNEEFTKNAKVLNNAKYKQYKDKQEKITPRAAENGKDDTNDDIEYVPVKNEKIILSSESECDKKSHSHRDKSKNQESKYRDVKVKREPRSPTRSRRRSRSNSRKKDVRKSRNSSSSSVSRDRSRSPHRKSTRKHKNGKARNDYSSDDSDDDSDNYKRRSKKSKKKSKKHKKEKKHKKKSHKSESESDSSSGDRRKKR